MSVFNPYQVKPFTSASQRLKRRYNDLRDNLVLRTVPEAEITAPQHVPLSFKDQDGRMTYWADFEIDEAIRIVCIHCHEMFGVNGNLRYDDNSNMLTVTPLGYCVGIKEKELPQRAKDLIALSETNYEEDQMSFS